MVCYIVPAACTVAAFLLGKSNKAGKKNLHLDSLFLMMFGGSIFGIVDHLWNGELLMTGPEPVLDLLLGVVISTAVFMAWMGLVVLDKHSNKERNPATFPNNIAKQ